MPSNQTTNQKNILNIADHGTGSKGLQLAGTLVTATAAQINAVANASTRVVNNTAATLTVTQASHDNKLITLNRAAGVAVTLPAASGSGCILKFFIQTSVTSNSTTIKVANSSDIMSGRAIMGSDNAADACLQFDTGASDDTITLNGTTTGGLKGDMITLMDIAANVWSVEIQATATGTEVTPFSATV